MNGFVPHERLAADTVAVAELGLCSVRLMNDRTWPWLVLVPRRADVREITDLRETDRRLLIEEIAVASRVLQSHYNPDKINIGALGNLVPQLHVHVIARFTDDPAWPKPVWGAQPPVPYAPAELDAAVAALRKAFGV